MHSTNSATLPLICKIYDNVFRFMDGIDLALTLWFSALLKNGDVTAIVFHSLGSMLVTLAMIFS